MQGRLKSIYRETIKQWRAVVASSVGGVLEWYDFVIYGYLAPIMASNFFPSSEPFLAQLATFGVFAAGFISRPLGGLLLGHIGDRFGRKPVLWISVILMGASTAGIGFLPDYSHAGDLAPILLVGLRVLQGLSLGGEFTGSTIYMAELASIKNRAYLASWPEFGCLCGFLAGSSIGMLLTAILTEQVMYEWGWRIPFWIGGGIAIFGVLIRQHLVETEAFLSAERSGEIPVIIAFRCYWKVVVQIVFLGACRTYAFEHKFQ
ncbi:MAG: MFS transporter [Endozoicomonas sp.]|uniref:MFS transporter n=1 Tax=Endozoicomonas sp. TaxID=1892382 RepID=UPI003D9B1BA2